MKINARLNTNDINYAIKQVENFKIGLQRKAVEFVTELAEIGIKVAQENTYVEYDEQYINMGDLITFTKDTVVDDTGAVCTLTATGQVYTKEWQGGAAQVNPLLMAEFGSGAKAIDGHRGTFPNQHVAFLNEWSWIDNSGQKHESRGSEPSRPLYKAKLEMESQIQTVAQRVFGS